MKILLTSDLYKPSVNGVVVSLLNLEKGLKERGHEVRILTLSPNRHSFKEGNVTFIGALPAGLVYPGIRIRYALAHPLIKDLIDWAPDVVHSNCEISTFIMAHKIAKSCQVPLVHTYHTVYEDYTHYFSPSKRVGTALVRKFSRMVANRTSAFIAPSVKVKKLLEGYHISAPLYVIPTGVDQTKFGPDVELPDKEEIRSELGLQDDDVVIINIGRLAKEKKPDLLVKYMEDFRDDKVKLVFIGDGPFRAKLEEQAKEMGILDKSVMFFGSVSPDEVGKYYHLGDLFVNTSNSETQGLTYFEALSSGIPVLCKKDECLDGIVEQGVDGWQFETEEEYKKYLKEFISNKGNRDAMHLAAVKTGEKFSVPAFAKAVEDVYKASIDHYSERPNRPPRKHRVAKRAKRVLRRIKKSRGVRLAGRAVRKIRSVRFLP